MIDRRWSAWRRNVAFGKRDPKIAGRVKQTIRTKRLKVTLPKLRFTEKEPQK